MNNSARSNLKIADKRIKKLIQVGKVTLVPLDESLITLLRLEIDSTMFQQEIVDEGILLRIVKTNEI